MSASPNFPWSAVLGQDALKRALLLCAIDPAIGGVLVQGPRGVAKTTLARALGELVQGAFVELPLGATEERVTGSLDLDAALRERRVAFAPGLLARAHQGVLYVDEVNLLPDALVDLLLDAAASGQNRIERDGVSHSHPARFVLIGTMNPEEGELRPQLIDRFGLSASADAEIPPAQRAEIVLRRLTFDRDPQAFCARFAPEQQALIARCLGARQRAAEIALDGRALELVAQRCYAARVEGVRADIAMLRAARAHAAWHERAEITAEDVAAVAELALAHRRRPGGSDPRGGGDGSNRTGGGSPAADSGGLGAAGAASAAGAGDAAGADDAADMRSRLGRAAADGGESRARDPALERAERSPERRHDSSTRDIDPTDSASDGLNGAPGPLGASGDRGARAAVPVAPQPTAALPRWITAGNVPSAALAERSARHDHGRPQAAAGQRRGRARQRARETGRSAERAARGAIDWFATLSLAPRPRRSDLRYRARRAPHAQRWVVAIDCSASMLRNAALARAKGLAQALLHEARRARAEVVLVSFRGDRVHTHAGPLRFARALETLQGGGGTPLRPALLAAFSVARQRRFGVTVRRQRLFVLSDGRTREPLADLAALRGGLEPLVIDCERGMVRLGRAARLAAQLAAGYVHMDDLR